MVEKGNEWRQLAKGAIESEESLMRKCVIKEQQEQSTHNSKCLTVSVFTVGGLHLNWIVHLKEQKEVKAMRKGKVSEYSYRSAK